MNASIPVERCKDFGSFKRRFVNSRALQEKIPQKISQLIGAQEQKRADERWAEKSRGEVYKLLNQESGCKNSNIILAR